MARERVYSGKKVLFASLILVVLFAIGMGYGTYAFAQWLTPILEKKNAKAVNAQPSAPLKANPQ